MKTYGNTYDLAPSWIVSEPTIYNVTMTNAATEYSQLLPVGTKRFSISIQDGIADDNYRISYITNHVATPTAPYLKYSCAVEKYEENLNLEETTIYFACSNSGKVAQVEAWR